MLTAQSINIELVDGVNSRVHIHNFIRSIPILIYSVGIEERDRIASVFV